MQEGWEVGISVCSYVLLKECKTSRCRASSGIVPNTFYHFNWCRTLYNKAREDNEAKKYTDCENARSFCVI